MFNSSLAYESDESMLYCRHKDEPPIPYAEIGRIPNVITANKSQNPLRREQKLTVHLANSKGEMVENQLFACNIEFFV